MKKFLFITITILFVMSFTHGAWAFVLSKAQKQYAHWPSSSIPISYKINPAGFPPGAIAAINNAFQAWEDVSTATISFTYDETTSTDTVADDDENVILWVTDSGKWNTDISKAAFTKVYVSTATGEISGADIQFNATPEFLTNYQWSTSGEGGKLDLQNMATHEVGHFIGIAHICDPGYPDNCQDPGSLSCRECTGTDGQTTMYPLMAKGEISKQTLEPDDIDGVSFIYPQTPVNIELVSGNDQSQPSGTPLSDPVVVKVTNTGGTPLQDEFVIFDITKGSGDLADYYPLQTDASGEAQTTFTPDTDDKVLVRAMAAGLENQIFWVNNHAPVLSWTGENNYVNDGLDPETGYNSTNFVFRIKYSDADNDAPAVNRVWIDVDGNDIFETGEDFDLNRYSIPTYRSGVRYRYETTIPFSAGSSNIKYYFEFRDRDDLPPAGGITDGIPGNPVNAPDVLPSIGLTVSSSASWSIGTIEKGSVHQSSIFEIINDSGIVQTLTLHINQEASAWTAGTTNGSESYALKALFSGLLDSPSEPLFTADDVVLNSGAVAASDTVFGDISLSANGLAVPDGEMRALWLQFSAPTDTTETQEQTIQVTLGAQP